MDIDKKHDAVYTDECNLFSMYGDTFFNTVRRLIKTLEIDFDDIELDIGIRSIWDELSHDKPGVIPTIHEPFVVHYYPDMIVLHMNEEISSFICYITEDLDQFAELSTMIENKLAIYMIKFKILNDYLSGISTPAEKEYLSKSEEILKQQLRPYSYVNSTEFKVIAFGRAFLYNEFKDKNDYLPYIDDKYKTTVQMLINARMVSNGFIYNDNHIEEDNNLFNEVLNLYHEFDHISSVSDINKIRDKYIKKQKSKYSKKLSALLNELECIYSIWEDIKEDTIKRFPIYEQSLRTSQLILMNNIGHLQTYFEEHSIGGANIPFYEYMRSKNPSGTLASMMFAYSNLHGAKLQVHFNIDELITEFVHGRFKGVTNEQKCFHYEFTLKHEMGHIVHHCEMLSNSDERTYRRMKRTLLRITDTEEHKRDVLPEDERIDYNYWYYTYLPMERRANELMGLTIEDVYREHFENIPLSVKRLLEEEKNK